MTDNETLLRDIHTQVQQTRADIAQVRESVVGLRAEDTAVRRELDLHRAADNASHKHLDDRLRLIETRMWGALVGSVLAVISAVASILLA